MRVVLCNGCFDLFHVGHLRHLEEASSMGALLVVGVTRDVMVGKGKGRPVIPEGDRLEIIRGLHCVDMAELCDDSIDALRYWKPHIYVKGSDYQVKGLHEKEIEYCDSKGIEIVFTKSPKQSTTQLIERIKFL